MTSRVEPIIPPEVKGGPKAAAFDFQGLIPNDEGDIPDISMDIIVKAWANTLEQRLKVAVDQAVREGVGVLVVREVSPPRMDGNTFHAGIHHMVEPSSLVPRGIIVYVDKEALDAWTDTIMKDGFKLQFPTEGQ